MPGKQSIYLGPTYQDVFDQMRAKLKIFLRAAVHACVFTKEIPSLEEFKRFLGRCFQELKYALTYAESFDDVIDLLIEEKCTIFNIGCLEIIFNHYNIEEAKTQITAYKLEVYRVCEELKFRICEDFMTGSSSLLKVDIIFFHLEWKPVSNILSDIKELLCKAFGDVAKIVNVIPKREFKGNIMIVVYHLSTCIH